MAGVASITSAALVLVIVSFLASFCGSSGSSDQWLFQSEAKWDKEWKSGAWDYMENVAVERAKVSIIGSVLVQMFARQNASVLDVGCGEGPISDFLTPGQRSHYVGIDISKEAILSAKRLRGPPLKFVHAVCHLFQPKNKFDVIIFSDMLYYVEYEKVLKQYEGYLNPGGIIIISIFHQSEKLMYENIWSFARQTFDQIDEIDVGGFTKKKKDADKERTAFHVEVYRVKPK